MTYMTMLARISCLPLRMISLQLVAKRNHVLCSPSFGIPRIKINPLSSGIHHEVYTRTSAKKASHWNDSFSAIKMLRGFRFVELGGFREIRLWGIWGTHQSSFAVRSKVAQVNGWIYDSWVIEVIFPAFNKEDLEFRIRLGQTTSCYACRKLASSDETDMCHDLRGTQWTEGNSKMYLQAAVPPPAKITSTSCRSHISKTVNWMSRTDWNQENVVETCREEKYGNEDRRTHQIAHEEIQQFKNTLPHQIH